MVYVSDNSIDYNLEDGSTERHGHETDSEVLFEYEFDDDMDFVFTNSYAYFD